MIETPPSGPELIGHFSSDSWINKQKKSEKCVDLFVMCRSDQCKRCRLVAFSTQHCTLMERMQQLAVRNGAPLLTNASDWKKKPTVINRRGWGERKRRRWRLDFGWWRGPSGTGAAFLSLEALGVRMKEPGDAVGRRRWGSWADRPSPQNSLTAPQQTGERGGRWRGGGKEEEQRRLREIKGALIKGLSLLSFDRGKEVEKEGWVGGGGRLQGNSMAMTTVGWGCRGEVILLPVALSISVYSSLQYSVLSLS